MFVAFGTYIKILLIVFLVETNEKFYYNKFFIFFFLGQEATQQATSNDIFIYKIKDYANFAEVDYYNIVVDKTSFNSDVIIGITIFSIIVFGFIGFVNFIYNKPKPVKGKKPRTYVLDPP